MHVRGVEEVPEPPPHLVEDLGPFLGRHPVDGQAGEGDGLRLAAANVEEPEAAALADQQLPAVAGEDEAADALGQALALAPLQVVREDLRLYVGGPAQVAGAAADVEQFAFDRAQAEVVVRVDRDTGDAPCQTVEIDPVAVLVVFVGAVFVVAVAVVVALVLLAAVAVLVAFLLVVFFFLDFDLVAPRREGMRRVLAQRERVDVRLAIGGVVVFETADLGLELPVGEEVEVVAARVEDGEEVVPHLGRHAGERPALDLEQVDRAERVLVAEFDRQVVPFRRPVVAGAEGTRVVGDLDDLAWPAGRVVVAPVTGVDDAEPSLLVDEGDAVAAGRPQQVVVVASDAALGELHGFAAAVLVHHPDLGFSAAIGREGDPPSVRRPGGTAVVGARAVGQVAGRSVLDRHAEDVAARGEGGALRLRAERVAGDSVRRRDPAWPAGELVRRHVHGDGARAAGGSVEDLERAGLLVDDPPVRLVGAGPTHVPPVLFGELLDFARGRVVGVEVQRAVTVGREVDRVADPHRVAVGALVVRDLDRLQTLDVEDPEVLRPAAFVPLPVPEVPGHRRVDDALAVRREIAAARLGHRQRPRQAAGDVDQEELRVAQVPAVPQRAEQNRRAVRRPAVDLVVVAPARRQRSGGRVKRQLSRRASGRRHDVDLFVAVVLAGKGDPLAVRRELGEQLQTRVRREAGSRAAGGGCEPDVAGVGERDPVAREIGESQEPGGLAGLGRARRRDRSEREQNDAASRRALDLTGDGHGNLRFAAHRSGTSSAAALSHVRGRHFRARCFG